MCGFVGVLGGPASPGDARAEPLLKRMADAIAHRGPDDEGYWQDVERRIAFGFRRLSILELSEAGHQPMVSESGRYVIVFNGEIYNHECLRNTLEGAGRRGPWRGHSDTETLLAGFDAWGIEGTIRRAIGMFGIAVWDKRMRELTLARDRLGEKPLYYGWQRRGTDGVFLFGSELKAMRAHPAFEDKVSRHALTLLLRHNCIPAPHSIYEGIAKLRPGHLLTVSLERREPQIRAYWSALDVISNGLANPFDDGPDRAVDALETLLKDAVLRQMMADVPLGAFLSGGVDSSTIVALMQAQSARPVKTFTIGFHESAFNEAKHAKAVAKHLGTEHTELYVTPAEAMAVIPCLPAIYDEPFSDSSQIPTFLVSKLARQDVTVALSGDGGDESFAGYTRYPVTARIWHALSAVPLPVRAVTAKVLASVSPRAWDRLAGAVQSWLPRSARFSHVGDKVHKGAKVLPSRSAEDVYIGLVTHWDEPESVVIGGREPATLLGVRSSALDALNDVQRMMALDTLTYLPDDILVKVDRAAMRVSLESRAPYLDHRVVDLAWRLPQSLKLRDGQTKWVLRQVLHRYVPEALVERPKMGFGVPIHEWLRGPLRAWAEELLDESRLRREGYFHPAPIRAAWREHLSGQRNLSHYLWDVLMFQAWLESLTPV